MEPPTAGIYFPENIPIKPSYLPPPAIDPKVVVPLVKTAS